MTQRALLWWGIGALITAVLLGVLVGPLFGEPTTGPDQWWNDVMVDIRSEPLLVFAQVMNRVGGGWIATFVIPIGTAVVLLLARRWRAAVFAVAAFAASALLVQALKQLFGRARPEDMLVVSDYGSFPSGHTANAATIAVVVWLLFPRVWTALLGIAWVVAMGLSRTALSVHWLSDTVGGTLAGAAAALLLGAALLPWVKRRGAVDERSIG